MKMILLEKDGKEISVDDEDYELFLQYEWRCYRCPQTTINGRAVVAGRFIALARGICTDVQLVIYKDKNPYNVCRNNLLVVTRSELSKRAKNRISNTGEKGIYRDHNRKYKVTLYKNKKSHFLGYYNSLEEAKIAYQKGLMNEISTDDRVS